MQEIKPRNFHNPVVVALGRLSRFKAGEPIDMNRVVEAVLTDVGFGADEIRDYGTLHADEDEDPAAVGMKLLRRKIHFAFRNQSGQSKGARGTTYSRTPMTQLVSIGKWALTETGAVVARRLTIQPMWVGANRRNEPAVTSATV